MLFLVAKEIGSGDVLYMGPGLKVNELENLGHDLPQGGTLNNVSIQKSMNGGKPILEWRPYSAS